MADLPLYAPTGGNSAGNQHQLTTVNYADIILRDAHAHKQLALNHVDLHALGCMLKLGEYVPASDNCRKILTRARRAQKNEILYLHKFLTIGSSENYLCDQLLKFRVGENVVALLSAAASVLGEEACIAMISALFECIGASPDNIPGRTQLENFRAPLVALARRSGFGEKVAHYHGIFARLLAQLDYLPQFDPYRSLADPIQMAKFIKLLHKVVTSDESFIVIWKGFQGAAWAAAYATYILGLNVCALDLNMNAIPITSSYEDAKVVIDLTGKQAACELYLEGQLQDIIMLPKEVKVKRKGWSIDCRALNLVDLLHPGIREKIDFGRASTFAAIELYNTLWGASEYFEQWTPDAVWCRNNIKPDIEHRDNSNYDYASVSHTIPGFKSYVKSVMPELFGRAIIVLRDLGFQPAMTGYTIVPDGSICTGHESDPLPKETIITTEGDEHYVLTAFGPRKVVGAGRTRTIVDNSGRWIGQGSDRKEVDRLDNYLKIERECRTMAPDTNFNSNNTYPSVSIDGYARVQLGDTHHHHHKDSSIAEMPISNRIAIAETIQLVVHLASRLAFTDWHHSVQLLSMNVLNFDEVFKSSGQGHFRGFGQERFEGLFSEIISFCFDGVETRELEMRLWSDDWLALDLDGFVVYRAVALKPDINGIRGKLVGFASGTIHFEGSRYKKVRNDRSVSLLDSGYPDIHAMPNPDPDSRDVDTTYQLRNQFPNTRLRPLVTASGDTVFLRTEAYLDDSRPMIIDGTRSSYNLQNLLVTTPCEHGYSTSCNMNVFRDHTQHLGRIFRGIFFSDIRRNGFIINPKLSASPVYIQQARDNPKLQWLALQWLPDADSERCLIVLQRDCCMPCLLKRICVVIESIRKSKAETIATGYPICIIAGDDPSVRLTLSKAYERKFSSHETQSIHSANLSIGRSKPAAPQPTRQSPSPNSSYSSTAPSHTTSETSEQLPNYTVSIKRKPVPRPS